MDPLQKFAAFREKMESAGVNESAILAFQHNYKKLLEESSGHLAERDIDRADGFANLADLGFTCQEFDQDLLSKTVVIKLNGGLGTSMGLQKAKSLLPVKDELTFLDIIIEQIEYLRESTGAPVKFLLMNSFSTSADTLEHLDSYIVDGFAETGKDIEMMQNSSPKVDASDEDVLGPVSWPANPELEWCPPGHGDLYPALVGSGWLDKLLADGVRYAFVSNSDNLGAVLDPCLLKHFATSGMPFMMEATRRTEADKKGGHLALRKSDGQLLLREVAQCPDEDLHMFQDINIHRYFNTNNLWLDLQSLRDELKAQNGILPLPMIQNRKTVDPRDKESTPVYQLETAMGAAIECFKGSGAVCVPRSRFAPVKSTADLFALRSDAYVRSVDGRIALAAERDGKPPVISLSDEYKLVDSLQGLGVPSLVKADKLSIEGPVRFCDGVVIEGTVSFVNKSTEPQWVAAGAYCDEAVELG
ncbi:UTP--glucose-1-phosphate uridylyltransferase [Persicirhabdus sediminis]|uniref:UTP--glucose-1-phosphate uridylyltransferase n=1 Tax=Persicirhabdus sediminis TaxID=454144 RepID=A0A8J7MBA8_9BACT|nr:UTP--glucose-1-phosphate uridylyltransferase [Persicirhabdus sediminis]MBK1789831.1 UTP--glucose-1-phosphate uridylyltransferase [Persicirhabdus sediminis]